MVVALVMGSLAFVVRGMTSSDMRHAQEGQTRQALAQAKEALIAWSATHASQPGALPCPDTNGDGYADTDIAPANSVLDATPTPAQDATRNNNALAGGYCSTAARRIGRLPWRTLRLPELTDVSGEPLWYALSDHFRRLGSRKINSNTRGQLTITGVARANDVVAIIFAPGPAIDGQNRNAANLNNIAHYLEGANADADALNQFETAIGSASFNDQLMPVREDDLFEIVENAVASRVTSMLRYYRDQWKQPSPSGIAKPIFPFAAPADPNQTVADFCGVIPPAGQPSEGLLPISEEPTCIRWTNPSISEPAGRVTNLVCQDQSGSVPPSEPDEDRMAAMVCTFDYSVGSGSNSPFVIRARVQSAAMTLALPIKLSDIKYGAAPYAGQNLGLEIAQSFIGGDLEVMYTGVIPPGAGSARIVFPIYSLRIKYPLSEGKTTAWFFNNEWYRFTYYAVIPQRLANSSGNCLPGTDCLTVSGLSAPADAEAILVSAGGALQNQTRPSSDISDYFEWQNASVGDRVFEKHRRTPQFNDQMRIVSP